VSAKCGKVTIFGLSAMKNRVFIVVSVVVEKSRVLVGFHVDTSVGKMN